ncbi:hypothetical protein BH11BAC2_BH11BAC2_17500 [soil metagenome]
MKRLILIAIVVLSVVVVNDVHAQCSVCRRGAETSLEAGEKTGHGLNSGILYLMSIPYVMGGVAGVIWWRHRKKNTNGSTEEI